MKCKKIICFFITYVVTIAGCAPDYVTKHGAYLYHSEECKGHDFPSKAEMEWYLDYMIEKSAECMDADVQDAVRHVISRATITLRCGTFQCGSVTAAGCANGLTLDVWWDKYIWSSPLFHEIMHPVLWYVIGETDGDHSEDYYWGVYPKHEHGVGCLNKWLYENLGESSPLDD